MLHQERERVMRDPGLATVFVNPQTGDIWSEVRRMIMMMMMIVMMIVIMI